jgi:hypothetical protein
MISFCFFTHVQHGFIFKKILQASDFESEVNHFRGFLHRFAFPYFLTRFLTDFFIYNKQISTENFYHILIK